MTIDDPEIDPDLKPASASATSKVAVTTVVGYLLYIVFTAPNDYMPGQLYLLLLPSAIVFTVLHFTQSLRGDKKNVLKEVAIGFWLGLILCFLVDFFFNLPNTFIEVIKNTIK